MFSFHQGSTVFMISPPPPPPRAKGGPEIGGRSFSSKFWSPTPHSFVVGKEVWFQEFRLGHRRFSVPPLRKNPILCFQRRIQYLVNLPLRGNPGFPAFPFSSWPVPSHCEGTPAFPLSPFFLARSFPL
jgi:hypothetical protein